MADDFKIKGSDLAEFLLHAKDISPAADGSRKKIFHAAQVMPNEYGSGGAYHLTSESAGMLAGLAAASTIYAFRWTNTQKLALVKRVRIQAWSNATGFAAGIAKFKLFRAINWTVGDTAGVTDTITGENGNLRTSMPSSSLPEIRHSSTAAMTAGTRTLDTQANDVLVATVGTAVQTVFVPKSPPLFDKSGVGDHPLVFAQNEGFVIQATVPATGVWDFAITPEWDEVDANLYTAS